MKIKLALVMALSLLVTLCSNVFASSNDSDPIVITDEQFKEFVKSGKFALNPVVKHFKNDRYSGIYYDSELNIHHSDNQLFWVDMVAKFLDEEIKDLVCVNGFQPFRIIDGMLLTIDPLRKLDPKTGKLTVINGNTDLVERILIELLYESQWFNLKFPIVFRSSDTEPLSLRHLTYIFCSTSPELIARLKNKADFKSITDKWMLIPSRMPEYYEKFVEMVKNKLPYPFNHDMRNYKQGIEQLFYQMMLLYRHRGDYNDATFLKKVFEIYNKFMKVYNKVTPDAEKNANKERIEKIKGYLKDPKTRDKMAKALLLDVFYYIEEPQFDWSSILRLVANNVKTVLYQKYGQMALFLDHASPHFASLDEETKLMLRKQLIFEKSIILLKEGVTMEDFYKLLIRLISDDAIPNKDDEQANSTYKVNDVAVSYMEDEKGNIIKDKSFIIIKVTLNKDFTNKLVYGMLATDGMGNIERTDQIVLVLEENHGSFYLKTAYPIRSKASEKQDISFKNEDKSAIYKLYNDVFLPPRLQQKNKEGGIILRVDSY